MAKKMHSPLLIKATLPFDLTIYSSVDTTTGQFESGKSLSSQFTLVETQFSF